MDPYVLCRLSDGSVRVLRGDADDPSRELTRSTSPTPSENFRREIPCRARVSVRRFRRRREPPGVGTRARPGSSCAPPRVRGGGATPATTGRALIVVAPGARSRCTLPSCERVWAADGLSDGARVLAPAGSRARRATTRASPRITPRTRPPRRISSSFAWTLRGGARAAAHRASRRRHGAGVSRVSVPERRAPHAPPQLRFARVPIELGGGGYGPVREDARREVD